MKKNKIITNINMRDIAAIVLIIGLIVLKFCGLDGTVTALLALAGGYYFGRRDVEISRRK